MAKSISRGEVIGAVVAFAEGAGELLDGQELDGGDAEALEVGDFAGHIEERAGLVWEVGSEEYADMELINDEIVELRGDESGRVPGKVGSADDAVAGEGGGQFAGKRVALEALSSIPDHKELVAMAILDSGHEPAPMSVGIADQEVVRGDGKAVELAADVDGVSVWGPDAEGGAVIDQIGAHGGIGRDVVEGGGHGVCG